MSDSSIRMLLLDQAEANRFINRTWLDVLRPLPMSVLDENRGAFFGSIFGTWNHILLGDRIWLGRLTGRAYPFQTLSDRVCDDFPTLERERALTDEELIGLVQEWKDPASPVGYRDTRGNPYTQPFHDILMHLFAHQHHHRGHISQMCHELKIPIPDGGVLGFYRSRMPRPG
jgi:uncharacterized damage-inducible protein DinB